MATLRGLAAFSVLMAPTAFLAFIGLSGLVTPAQAQWASAIAVVWLIGSLAVLIWLQHRGAQIDPADYREVLVFEKMDYQGEGHANLARFLGAAMTIRNRHTKTISYRITRIDGYPSDYPAFRFPLVGDLGPGQANKRFISTLRDVPLPHRLDHVFDVEYEIRSRRQIAGDPFTLEAACSRDDYWRPIRVGPEGGNVDDRNRRTPRVRYRVPMAMAHSTTGPAPCDAAARIWR
jgi:hypothetical protein